MAVKDGGYLARRLLGSSGGCHDLGAPGAAAAAAQPVYGRLVDSRQRAQGTRYQVQLVLYDELGRVEAAGAVVAE